MFIVIDVYCGVIEEMRRFDHPAQVKGFLMEWLAEHGFDSLEEVNDSADYTLGVWQGERLLEDVTHNFEGGL